MAWNRYERENLAHLLHETGPDGPTLCEGWRTRHLAVHLVQREHAAVRRSLSYVWPMSLRRDAAMTEAALRVADDVAYHDLVDRFLHEPAPLHPAHWAGEAMNLIEYFVHAEDVRRASDLPDPGPAVPRELAPGESNAIWDRFTSLAPLLMRKAGIPVVFVLPDGRRTVTGPKTGAAAQNAIVARGDVAELLLFTYGRGARSNVELQGDPAQIAELTAKFPSTR